MKHEDAFVLLHDRCHRDVGRARAARTARYERERRLRKLCFEEISTEQRTENLEDALFWFDVD